jgi:hypothetical protein
MEALIVNATRMYVGSLPENCHAAAAKGLSDGLFSN